MEYSLLSLKLSCNMMIIGYLEDFINSKLLFTTFSSGKLLCKYCLNGALFDNRTLRIPLLDLIIHSSPIGEDIIL